MWQGHPLMRAHTFNEAEIRTPEGGFVVGLSVDESDRAEGYDERPESGFDSRRLSKVDR
jgi:hypothetical protein